MDVNHAIYCQKHLKKLLRKYNLLLVKTQLYIIIHLIIRSTILLNYCSFASCLYFVYVSNGNIIDKFSQLVSPSYFTYFLETRKNIKKVGRIWAARPGSTSSRYCPS